MNRAQKAVKDTTPPRGRAEGRSPTPGQSLSRLTRNPALLSSASEHWTTPKVVLDRLFKLGRPALDPCSNFASQVGALQEFWGKHFEGEEMNRIKLKLEQAQASGRNALLRDGLVESWQGFVSFVYVNCPYGKQLPAWLKKCADERDLGAEVIALIPSRTDTVAFHEQVFARANAGCFWRGRIQFGNAPPDSKSPGSTFPSFVAYYGRRIDDFFAAFDGAGELCRLNTRVYSEDEHVDG